MKPVISGIQQIGIGIPDVHAAFKWYRENLGMDIPIFEEAAEANLMLPYTGGKPHHLADMDLQHGLKLTSACGFPSYTNFSAGFHSCLDYIFVESDSLCVDRVIPLPTHEEVTRFTALPNKEFPSDHQKSAPPELRRWWR